MIKEELYEKFNTWCNEPETTRKSRRAMFDEIYEGANKQIINAYYGKDIASLANLLKPYLQKDFEEENEKK